jgi:hypothetical protein
MRRYRNRLPPQNDEILGSSREEARQLVSQDPFDIVCLFDFDANPYRIDRRLNQDLFIFIAGYMHRVEDDLGGCSAF